MEQMERLKLLCKTELKLSDELDFKLERTIRQVISRILDFCNRDDLPAPLEDMVVSIVEDMLKADGTVEVKQEINSISRGDTTIAYRNTGISAVGKALATSDFIKDFESQLIKHKKLRKLV